ncbi:CYTH domain-containing protein [Streptomyces clavuligerus]|uniref:CYTH domain-containing protein n=1 Tax=Streptomyces clavuligerus TaxID=1901 RepID=UPI00017FFB38|nr:CYTH domain-containing protein [Streptomyces clavuligerus]EDY50216.1 adenylate cyclase [Streptomyces clavuligerus]WDN51973.1 CYTH domain-containing protein [Streptomyces clavuligerus]
MATEIERKFVVGDLGAVLRIPAVTVRQGYLARSTDEEVRVRQIGDEYTLTVKKGNGLQRSEFEILIDASQFNALWPATEGSRIAKTRREVELPENRLAHVDVFEGHLEGLATVEVEFADTGAAGAFTPPAWFGREVTEDRRYSNKVLSSEGAPV